MLVDMIQNISDTFSIINKQSLSLVSDKYTSVQGNV